MNWYTVAKQKSNWDYAKGFFGGVGIGALSIMNNHQHPAEPQSQPIHVAPAQSKQPATQPSTRPVEPTTQPFSTQPSLKPATQPAATQPSVPTNILVARVLFSETAGVSDEERFLVASTIKNRIGNKNFGGGKDMQGVVKTKNAFEALGDSKNTNWSKSSEPVKFNPKERQIWESCVKLSAGNFQPAKGPSGRPIMYYHDKSITKPSNWDNKYFTAVKEIETAHFIFYSVVPN